MIVIINKIKSSFMNIKNSFLILQRKMIDFQHLHVYLGNKTLLQIIAIKNCLEFKHHFLINSKHSSGYPSYYRFPDYLHQYLPVPSAIAFRHSICYFVDFKIFHYKFFCSYNNSLLGFLFHYFNLLCQLVLLYFFAHVYVVQKTFINIISKKQ